MRCFLNTVACLLLSSTAALAASNLDAELASAPALRAAAEAACDLNGLGADTSYHVGDGLNDSANPADIQKSAEWLKRYDLFAFTRAPELLADYAHLLKLWKGPDVRLRDAECAILVPAYGAAVTTEHLVEPTSRVFDSSLVSNGASGLKLNPDLASIPHQCETSEYSTRYIKWCRKDANGVRGGSPF